MAAQDPHHPSAKAHHTPESDHAVQVLYGALQTMHDHHSKDNVKSTRHLHPLQVPDHPVHRSITHEGEGQEPTTHPPHDFPLPRLAHRLRAPVAASMIVLLGLRLRRAVALLRGVERGSIGGIGRMSMLLLLPLQVLPFRMNGRGLRQVVVLEGRQCRAMVAEGGIVDRVILVIGGICLLRLRGLEVILDWIVVELLTNPPANKLKSDF